MELEVRDNPAKQRYEVEADGELAGFITYRERPNAIELVHTQVEDAFEGKGVGSKLVQRTLDDIRARGLALVPTCPFVKAFVERHPEYQDLVAS
jgi:predicted GNAT family acetyltransferase